MHRADGIIINKQNYSKWFKPYNRFCLYAINKFINILQCFGLHAVHIIAINNYLNFLFLTKISDFIVVYYGQL